jgi:hypothetical protein
MSKKFWELAGTLEPVETKGGGKVAQDYFGMHNEKFADQATTTARAFGSKARDFVDETERKRLNAGKLFEGFLSRQSVRHLFLYIANHSIHGVCVYVDQKTSRPPTEIEILTNKTKDRLIVDSNSFFDLLTSEPIEESIVKELCEIYEKYHILMIRD